MPLPQTEDSGMWRSLAILLVALLTCGLFAESPRVTRAQLKQAVVQRNWDLLDRLLELDASSINDNALFSDSWGEWWGLLIECVSKDHVNGVRVLLKHGANPQLATWGDGEHTFPLAVAEKRKNETIYRLLCGLDKPIYQRNSEPVVPAPNAQDEAINRQGETLKNQGVIFPESK